MGKYDLPSNIDKVLELTGVEKIIYFGHSQGTTQFWIGNILNETLGSKIEAMIGFAPVMFVGNQNSFLVTECLKYGIDLLLEKDFTKVLVLRQGSSLLNDDILKYAPTILEYIPRTVWTGVQWIVGFDKVSHMSTRRMPMMARNDVGGTGTINLKHWANNIKSGKFQDFHGQDYEVEKLQERLNGIKLLLFVGETDALSQPDDFSKLENLLSKDTI